MEPSQAPSVHVFVRTLSRPEGLGASCGARGADRVVERLQLELLRRGRPAAGRVTGCACLGPCGEGPDLVVHPEGVADSRVSVGDVPELVARHGPRPSDAAPPRRHAHS